MRTQQIAAFPGEKTGTEEIAAGGKARSQAPARGAAFMAGDI